MKEKNRMRVEIESGLRYVRRQEMLENLYKEMDMMEYYQCAKGH